MNAPRGEETIFAEALRLPAEERAAYVAQATHGDAELRRRIESLLGSYQAGGFLEQAAAPQLRETLSIPLTEKPGDTIGRYKLLQQIGEGGCGVVYMAEQAEPVRRRVALKIIKLGMDTKSVIARFEAERQALALMDHPNIAKVFDAGATGVAGSEISNLKSQIPVGRPYFVMELVRGKKITDYCDEKKLPTHERLDLFTQVCRAIQHAHQKGIIHRDVKPSNILVTVNDGVPVPKVIDFGIAKATGGQQLTDKTLFTAFEQFIGTPAYMSPEQAVLTSLDIDTRSDIYALGVLLYELLTGRTPFDAKELLAIGLDEMRRTIREQEPPSPSTRLSTLSGEELSTTAQRRGLEAPELVSELRGDLDWIVMKALEKDRARRYETANGLAMDIQRHLNNEPVVARPPSNLYRFQKLVQRNKLLFVAGAAVVAALLFGLGISSWMFLQERAALGRAVTAEQAQRRLRREAQADTKKAQTEAAKSQQVAQFLQDMLKGVGPSVAAGQDTKLLQEILDRTEERLGNELTNQPEVEAELRNAIGSVYFELGQYDQAEAMFTRSLVLLRQVFGNDDVAVADALHNLAELDYHIGKNKESETNARQALAIYLKRFGPQSGKVGASLNTLGFALRNVGKLAEAKTNLQEALEINRKAFGKEHPQVGLSLSRLGAVLTDQNKLHEAESMLREAVRIQKKVPSGVKLFGLVASKVELGWTLSYLSGVLEKQGKLSEAETNLSEAVALMSKVLPKGRNDRLTMLGNLAAFHRRHSQWKQAETEYRELLAMYRALPGNDNPNVVVTLNSLAEVLENEGKLAEAETTFRQALAAARKLKGDEDSNVASILNNLAFLLAQEGKLTEAEAKYRQALAALRKLKGNEDSNVASILDNLAFLFEQEGKLTEAETQFREELAIRKKHETNDPLLNAFFDLWHVLQAEHKSKESESVARQALALVKSHWGNKDFRVGAWLDNVAESLPDNAAEAESLLRQALGTLKTVDTNAPAYLSRLRLLDHLSGALYRQGKFSETESTLRDALGVIRQSPKAAQSYEDSGLVLMNLAEVLLRQRKALAEARSLAEESKELYQQHTNWTAANAFGGFRILNMILEQLGDFSAMDALRRDYLPRLRERFPPDDPEWAGLLADLTMRLLNRTNFTAAEPLARECLAIREKKVPDDWRTFNARSMLGGCLLAQKKYAKAKPLLLAGYEGMIEREDRIPPAGRPRLKETLGRLAQLYQATGAPDRAAQWKQRQAEFDQTEQLRTRGAQRARHGQWKEAAADLARVSDNYPDDDFVWHELAALFVANGQLGDYGEHCRESAERFAHTSNPVIAERIAKDCLILPDSGVDPALVAKMADTAAAATNHWATPWFQLVKGLAEYRQTRFASAVDWMNKALAQPDKSSRDVEAYMVLAMADYRLKQTDKARAAFVKGAEVERTKLPKLKSGDIGDGWLDWIMAHALVREATSLIEAPSETKITAK